jgi:drug/metabolite transporter (DMT)-like permease
VGWVYIIGGLVVFLLGLLIVVFREGYTRWQNRVTKRRGGKSYFTVTTSLVYGDFAMAAGIFSIVFLGVLRK